MPVSSFRTHQFRKLYTFYRNSGNKINTPGMSDFHLQRPARRPQEFSKVSIDQTGKPITFLEFLEQERIDEQKLHYLKDLIVKKLKVGQ